MIQFLDSSTSISYIIYYSREKMIGIMNTINPRIMIRDFGLNALFEDNCTLLG